jgi:hypothetical protein
MEMKLREQAREYVQCLELPEPPSRLRRSGPGENSETVMAALATTREHAAVVGSEVVAFAEGVDGTHRQDLINSTLLAQLVANKKVPDRSRLFDWYDAYYDALANIGWSVQDRHFAIYVESSENFEAHEAILKVAATVLGTSPAALVLVTNTLEALQAMEEQSPWLTLFARESQSAETASFQISAVEQGTDHDPFVSLLAFSLQARARMTQVLFFKGRTSDVTLRHCSGRMSINVDVVAAVRQALKDKLAAHVTDYVRALPDDL